MADNSRNSAVVYCEKNFGGMDGKTANGLVRFSQKYKIVSVIDSEKAGQDAGQVLDGQKNGIPIVKDLAQAIEQFGSAPDFFILGMAPLHGFLSPHEGKIILHAMEQGMHIVNGLHEFLSEDRVFVQKAKTCDVKIYDIRRPKAKKDLRVFSGTISEVKCAKIAVLGTDSAIGKRTTATVLNRTLRKAGINSIMVGTGQTSLIQGAKYGAALDALPGQFISGAMEEAMVDAYRSEKPDVLIIEGQGALSHPAYLSSCYIVRGSRPNAVILQHAPHRKMLGDYPNIPMPSLRSEINLIETFSGANVIGITINHEDMNDEEVDAVIARYQDEFSLPVTDALTKDPAKLVSMTLSAFPELEQKITEPW